MSDWLILAAVMTVFYVAALVWRKTQGRERIRYLFLTGSAAMFLFLMWPVALNAGKGFLTQFALWFGMTALAGGYMIFLERQADAE